MLKMKYRLTILSTIMVFLFGSFGYIYKIIFSDYLTGKIEIPIVKELSWNENMNEFKESNPKNIDGKIVFIYNGTPSEQLFSLEQFNELNIQHVLIGQNDLSKNLLYKNKANGEFNEKIVRIESLQIDPLNEMFVLFFSNDPGKPASISDETIVKNNGKKIHSLLFSSPLHPWLLAVAFIITGTIIGPRLTPIFKFLRELILKATSD